MQFNQFIQYIEYKSSNFSYRKVCKKYLKTSYHFYNQRRIFDRLRFSQKIAGDSLCSLIQILLASSPYEVDVRADSSCHIQNQRPKIY